LGDRWLSSS